MKKYGWTKENIVSDLRALSTLVDEEKDLSKKYFFKKALDALNNYYFCGMAFAKKEGDLEPDFPTSIYNLTNSFTGMGRYYSILGEILKIWIPFQDKTFDINETISTSIKNNKLRIFTTPEFSYDKCYSLVREFYNSTDKELFEHFRKQYNRRYTDTNFSIPPINNIPGMNAIGDCMYIAGIDKNYITIEENHSVIEYCDLIHENGHALANRMNPKKSCSDFVNMYFEVESLFPELLALEFGKNYFSELELNYMKFAKFDTYLTFGKYLSFHKYIVDIWQDEDFKIDDNLKNKIMHNLDLQENSLDIITSLNIENYGGYIISYAISLGLLNIYKREPQKALELYKYIINTQDNVDSLEVINGNINEKAIEEETNNIIDGLILSLRKKGVNYDSME